MKKIKQFIKKNKINIAIIIGFFILASIYFAPAMQGYTLKMDDIKGVNGMNKELLDFEKDHNSQAIWTNSMFSGMPGYLIYFEKLNIVNYIHRIFYNTIPYPVFPIFLAFLTFYFLARILKTSYPISILGAIAYGLATYNIFIIDAGHITKVLAIAYFPSVLASIFMVYRHKNKLLSFGLLSFFFALEIMVNHIQMTYYFVFIIIGVGISEFINYYKKNELKEFINRSLIIILAGGIALATNFTNYYFLYKYAEKSIRGATELTVTPNNSKIAKDDNKSKGLDKDYIVQWSYGKQETINLVIPLAKGKNSLVNDYFEQLGKTNQKLAQEAYQEYQNNGGKLFSGYWGNQPFTSGPNYVGAIMMFLALLYVLLINKPFKWILLFISILVIMLSWGDNLGGSVEKMWLTNFFIDYIPLYNKFRAVSSILVVINFIVPLMSILFLKEFFENDKWRKENVKRVYIFSGVIISLFVVLMLSPASFFDFLSKNEQTIFSKMNNINLEESIINFRIDIFKSSALRSIGLMLTAFTLLFAFSKDLLKKSYTLYILIVLVLFDFWNIDKQFLNNDKNPKNKREYLRWEKAKIGTNRPQLIKADTEILNIETQLKPEIKGIINARISKAKKSTKGRFTNILKENETFAALNFATNYRVLELDNPFNSSRTSFFHKSTGGYSPAKIRRYQDIIDFYISKELSFLSTNELEKMKVLNMLNNKYYIYKGNLIASNKYAKGNAWFVDNILKVETPDEEILAIDSINTSNTAIVNVKFNSILEGKNLSKDPSATITMKSYLPNHISYVSNSNKEQLAIFSEIYYEDGWNAYINDKKVEHLQANYILRGLVIPQGNNNIDFRFEPKGVLMGNIITIITFLIILGSIIFGFLRKRTSLE